MLGSQILEVGMSKVKGGAESGEGLPIVTAPRERPHSLEGGVTGAHP